MIAHQGEPPGGKLDPDLVAAARAEPDAHEAFLPFGQTAKFQPGLFYTAPLTFYHEDLVLLAVLPQKVLPVAAFGRGAVDHGHVFLDHGAFLYGFGEGSGGLLGAGIDHHTAHVFIQPVNGEDVAAKAFLQSGRNFRFGIQAHRLDADDDLLVGIKNFHGCTSGICVSSSIPQRREKSKERLREIGI